MCYFFKNWYKKAQEQQRLYDIHRKEYVNYNDALYDSLPENEQDQYWTDLRKKRKDWDNSVQQALSTGQISAEDAIQKGYHGDAGDKIVPLPAELFHVTTAKSAVIKDSLKTRDELSQSLGKGLGGGASNTISFTSDLSIGVGIYNGIIEAKQVASGEISARKLIGQAIDGVKSKKPWIEHIKEYYKIKDDKDLENYINELDGGYIIKNSYFPESLEKFNTKEEEFKGKWKPISKSKWEHGNSTVPQYQQFIRKATLEEQRNRLFDFYKSWSTFREHYGEGPLNPLFFSTDVMGLANIPEEEIALLKFKPFPGALGYQVGSLGEWRTWSGQGVEFVREIL
jgi:hypothetical protein